MYLHKLVVGSSQTNCYIIANTDTKECAVIDPGNDSSIIIDIIESNNFKLDKILITHAHFDHIGAIDDIKKFSNASIIISGTDGTILNSDTLTLSTAFGTVAPKSKPDFFVDDGDILEIAGYTARVISTPGHTPGSVCYYFESENILFSGDTLFRDSIGRSDFPGGDFKSITESIKSKLFTLPPDTKVYPGHNDDTTILHEKENNFYLI